MAAEEENNKKNEGRGFAGLSSLVSEVDTTPPPAAPKKESPESPSSTRLPNSQSPKPEPKPPAQRQTYQESPQPSSSSAGGKWVLGIAAVVGLLWLIGQSYKNTPSPAPVDSPPAQSTAPSNSPPAQPQAPSLPLESKPPVDRDLVLSTAQIRYCLAEDIRIEGAEAALNNYSDSDVDRFNAMVDDYNSRCGSFRYRSGALEGARLDVEPYRGQLQAAGRSRFAPSPSTGSLSVPAPTRPAPEATVRAVQQKLNELGYNAGPVDGLMGRRTRTAIIAFQQDRGLTATGVADQAMLLQLQRAPAHSTATSTTSSPSTSSSPSALATAPAPQPHRSLSSGKPDLTNASPSEQASIENACNYDRQYRSSADYYNCLRRELAKLSAHSGKPDLSRVSQSEQAAIENACNYDRQYRGPGDYYSCLRRELAKLGNTAGKPSLAQATSWEQAAIENACNYDRQYRGPGDYYNCLRRELQKLASSQGKPDLSRIAQFERASIEKTCNYDRQYRGPGDYYGCLHRELNKLR